MNPEMWEELRVEAEKMNCTMMSVNPAEFIKAMNRIERRHLPERVAEILEKAEHNNMYMTCGGLTGTTQIIAKALRTGDLSEIEKWVKK